MPAQLCNRPAHRDVLTQRQADSSHVKENKKKIANKHASIQREQISHTV
jgi:hypothetical protein